MANVIGRPVVKRSSGPKAIGTSTKPIETISGVVEIRNWDKASRTDASAIPPRDIVLDGPASD